MQVLVAVPEKHAEALADRFNENGGFHVARVVGSVRQQQEFVLTLP